MALDPRIAMGFETSQIYNPVKAQAQQQELALGRQKIQSGSMDMQNDKVKRAAQYLAMATPENWQAIRSHAIGEGLGDEATIPAEFNQDWINKTRSAFDTHQTQTPSAIQEYQYYQGLDPAAQKNYLEVKRNPQYLNAGDKFIAPGTGDIIPKGISPDARPELKAEQETAKKKAGIITEAQAALPGVVSNAELALDNLDHMIGNKDKNIPESPGLERAVGPNSSRLPTIRGSTADFEKRVDQALGGAFLEAYGALRGGGAITEIEGAKATAAKTRMSLANSEEGFRQAAAEYRDIIRKGVERAKAMAAGAAFEPATANPASTPVEETRVIGGKTYHKINGKWHE